MSEIKATELFTVEELAQIVLNFMQGRESKGASEAEMIQVVEWAHQARADSLMLRLVLENKVHIGLGEEGKIVFKKRHDAG